METTNPFSKEVQNQVAKLLARENIRIVRSYDFSTAYFDVKDRVLGLPVYKEDTPRELYDLFIGHEVGHALYTKMSDFEELLKKFDKNLINILEDIRIEKKIQDAYPGLRRCFREGYKILLAKDFFGDTNKFGTYTFRDRLNLLAKTGVDLPFNDEELPLMKEAMAIETIEDLERVARLIMDFEKANLPKQSQQNASSDQPDDSGEAAEDPTNQPNSVPSDDEGDAEETDGDGSSDGDEGSSDSSDSSDSGDTTEASDDKGSGDSANDEGEDEGDGESLAGGKQEDPESKNIEADEDAETKASDGTGGDNLSDVQQAIENAMQEFTAEESKENSHRRRFEFIEPSREEIFTKHVRDYKEILKDRSEPGMHPYVNDVMGSEHEAYRKFMKDIKNEVNLLVNEFQRRKAARAYSRRRESMTGVIDVNKLSEYKYNDQIFLAVDEVLEEKSHGMVFLLDYSGSMSGSLLASNARRLLIMSNFCRKCNIPFEIYAWTDNGDHAGRSWSALDTNPVNGIIHVALSRTCLNNFLSSRMNKKEFELASLQFHWLCVQHHASYHNNSGITRSERMGSTPLVESLVVVDYIIREFKKINGCEKTSLMILSDGQPNNQNLNFATGMYGRGIGNLAGKRIDFGRKSPSDYDTLLDHIKSRNVRVIGYYEMHHDVSPGRVADRHGVYSHRGNVRNKFFSDLRKKTVANIKYRTYDDYFVIANVTKAAVANTMNDHYDNRNNLKNDFLKAASSKRQDKMFTRELITSIA